MPFSQLVVSFWLAQTEGGALQGELMNKLITFGGPILMFAVIYLLLIRPAGKQRREHAEMLNALKKDDEVITSGGIVGKITNLEERLVTLEVADKVKIRVLRDRVVGRFNPVAKAPPITK